jgi:large conductance mechanosensitive channel
MQKKINVEDVKKKSKGLMNEFKLFMAKGNAIDLAVGVVIGSAFGKIVSSIVDDILMPIIGVLIGGIDFTTLSITIGDANIKYGIFINNVVDFIIIAFFIFLFVKFINHLTRKKEEEKPVSKSNEVILLEQILAELKKEK